MSSLVPKLGQVLGLALYGEDLRVDFVSVGQIAEARLQKALSARDSNHLAEALLSRGVVHLLQGEISAVTKCFDESLCQMPDNHAHALITFGYSTLATRLRFLVTCPQ